MEHHGALSALVVRLRRRIERRDVPLFDQFVHHVESGAPLFAVHDELVVLVEHAASVGEEMGYMTASQLIYASMTY